MNNVHIGKGNRFLKINYTTINGKVSYRTYEWVNILSQATTIPNLDALAIKGELERKGNLVRIYC